MKYTLIFFIVIFLSILLSFSLKSEKNTSKIKIVFYNVENLFDTFDDTLKNDNEFLPNSIKKWTIDRYNNKINNIYKVIVAIGGWEPPAIIGLCEIENKYVLNSLVNNTPLNKYDYDIIHYESPDNRGIDVGCIYLKNAFKPIYSYPVEINFPGSPRSKTRDILYIKGILNKIDTLHLFINHWPSRMGGQGKTEKKRIYVAEVLKSKTDSIFSINPKSNIVIMGDFNDEKDDKSIAEFLIGGDSKQLIPMIGNSDDKNSGTIKYKGSWSIFDQIIISENILNKQNPIQCNINDAVIFKPDFLLHEDDKHTGYEPFRTYSGSKYFGGFSDHLPVVLELTINN